MKSRGMAVLLMMGVAAGLVLPGAAQAGSKGRRNTAIGLSGLAAYQLLHGHTTTGALAAGGALYAWKRTADARKAEKRRARYARAYRSRRHTHHHTRTAYRYR